MTAPGTVEPSRLHRPRRDRRRALLKCALTVALAAPVVACGSTQEKASKADSAISYRATDVGTGKAVSLATLRGRPALLSSWATWCAPCRRELPELQELHQAQGDDGLQVVVVNVDSPDVAAAEIDGMATSLGLTMPQWRDPEGDFTSTFKGFGIPMSVLIDDNGQVLKTWHGILRPNDPEVRDRIAKAIRGTSGS